MVPVLWDKLRCTIVKNDSADIIALLNCAFDAWGNAGVNLRPAQLNSALMITFITASTKPVLQPLSPLMGTCDRRFHDA